MDIVKDLFRKRYGYCQGTHEIDMCIEYCYLMIFTETLPTDKIWYKFESYDLETFRIIYKIIEGQYLDQLQLNELNELSKTNRIVGSAHEGDPL